VVTCFFGVTVDDEDCVFAALRLCVNSFFIVIINPSVSNQRQSKAFGIYFCPAVCRFVFYNSVICLKPAGMAPKKVLMEDVFSLVNIDFNCDKCIAYQRLNIYLHSFERNSSAKNRQRIYYICSVRMH
jgi:hypothetical protein